MGCKNIGKKKEKKKKSLFASENLLYRTIPCSAIVKINIDGAWEMKLGWSMWWAREMQQTPLIKKKGEQNDF